MVERLRLGTKQKSAANLHQPDFLANSVRMVMDFEYSALVSSFKSRTKNLLTFCPLMTDHFFSLLIAFDSLLHLS
jgi:hypothetical protein